MKKTGMIFIAVATMFTLSGCLDGGNPTAAEKVTYKLSPKQVWDQSCHKCHGEKAEGLTEKKTPPMNDRQAGELELDLYDVKNDGISMSSGTDHEKMAHNMKKLIDKGYDYDPKAMADFIEKNYYIKPAAN